MAKKTSKQGKTAKKNTEKKTAESASQSPIIDKKAAKAAQSAAQSPIVDNKKAAKKPEKPAKTQKKAAQKPSKGGKQGQKKDSIFKKIFTYFKNVRLEIKRTTWPNRNEVFRMSLIVVGALLFFGVLIFFIDWGMTRLLELYANVTHSAPAAPEVDTSLEESALDYIKALWGQYHV